MNGLHYLKHGEAYNSHAPLLSSILSAFPLLFLDVEEIPAEELQHMARDVVTVFPYYKNNNLDTITFWSRIGSILVAIAVAYYVYRWASELYGIKAGLLALFIYTFNPVILAWSATAYTDFLSAGFMFIASYYYWNFLVTQRRGHLVTSGVIYGLALATKITALFLLPILIISYFIYSRPISWTKVRSGFFCVFIIASLGFSSLFLIHIGDVKPIYDLNDPFYQNGTSAWFRSEERLNGILDTFGSRDSGLRAFVKTVATEVPIPASTFFDAVISHSNTNKEKSTSYLFGEWKHGGWWYYYLVALIIQVPIPILLFFLMAIIFVRQLKRREIHHEIYLLIPVFFWLLLFSFVSRLDLGLRHILIIFPFSIVFASKVVHFRVKNFERTVKSSFYILCIWLIATTVLTFPFYHNYFNEIIGGSQDGYKYLTTDAGPNIRHIGPYMEEHNLTSVKFRAPAVERPEYRSVWYEELTCAPATGVIIIGTGPLVGGYYSTDEDFSGEVNENCFGWLQQLEPVDNIGYSLLVYNVNEADLENIGY